MPKPVLLKDIVDALEMQFDEVYSFLDLDTGQVEFMSHDELLAAEQDDDDDPEGELATRIAFLDRVVTLPTKREVHEWQIMSDFADSVQHRDTQDELLDAIHGAGVFRNFKNIIRRRGIEKSWHEFRTRAVTEIAVEWCRRHKIPWL